MKAIVEGWRYECIPNPGTLLRADLFTEKATMRAAKLCLLMLSAYALVFSTEAQNFLTNGLVAYYPLDGDTLDASGHGINGIAFGAVPATNRFGVADKCYAFNGTGHYHPKTTRSKRK